MSGGVTVRTYYRDERIRITSTAIWVDDRRYLLRELERVWRQGLPVLGRRMLLGVALLLIAAVAFLWALFVVLAGAVALWGIEDIRRYGRRLELWANVRGCPVLLVRTDDAIRYGRVRRALIRALNDRDDTTWS